MSYAQDRLRLELLGSRMMEPSKGVGKKAEAKQSTADDGLAVRESSNVIPVIIEELDETAISSMDVDLTEFVEAKALQIREVVDVAPTCILSPSCSNSSRYTPPKDAVVDAEEQDTSLTADEEDRLTKQFLNGELTFSEYSSRMDQDVDLLEATESDTSRYMCVCVCVCR